MDLGIPDRVPGATLRRAGGDEMDQGGERWCTGEEGFTTRDLLEFARGHAASARVLRERSFECYDSAAALAHLAIEQILKAIILRNVGRFPATHDLPRLLKHSGIALAEAEKAILSNADRLERIRYPKPGGSESIGTVDLEEIEKLFIRLIDFLPPDLQQELASRDFTTKGGRVLLRMPISEEHGRSKE
jgi:HEPN domain-containing protein